MIKHYQLVSRSNITELNNIISEMLQEGWDLYGPPSMFIGGSVHYIQALIWQRV